MPDRVLVRVRVRVRVRARVCAAPCQIASCETRRGVRVGVLARG